MTARSKTTAKAAAAARARPATEPGPGTRGEGGGRKGGRGTDPDGVVTIKKYANRRLYNTATSSYVTLDHLCQMVKDDVDFVVYDAKTGEDITRAVLTQIIVEEESKGQNLLPISFLRQLIGFYGDNLQMVVPRYLETAMAAFAENEERMRSYMQGAFGGMFPFAPFEDMTKHNVAMFENAMRMFNPMTAGLPRSAAQQDMPEGAAAETAEVDVQMLKAHLDLLQRQLDALGGLASSAKNSDPAEDPSAPEEDGSGSGKA